MTKPFVHPWWAHPNEPGAPMFIQWKGTDVCMDVTCPKCRLRGHIDGYFAYAIKCAGCGAMFKLGQAVSLREFTAEEWPDAGPLIFGDDAGVAMNDGGNDGR